MTSVHDHRESPPAMSGQTAAGVRLPDLLGRALANAPFLRWLTPETLVQLESENGLISTWWCGNTIKAASPSRRSSTRKSQLPVSLTSGSSRGQSPDAMAVEIPESMVLRSRLALPAMSARDTSDALALEARRLSPFPADELVWNATREESPADRLPLFIRSRSQSPVRPADWTIVLASRRQIAQWIATINAERTRAVSPEVWVVSGLRQPLVLPGFGEEQRLRQQAKGRRWGLLLAVTALALMGTIAVTPTLQLRSRAVQASSSFEDLSKSAATAVNQRDAVVKNIAELTALGALTAQSLDSVWLLAKVTDLMPNNTHLQSLTAVLVPGGAPGSAKITVSGQTDNTAELMQRMSAAEGVSAVKAPISANRPAGSSKEVFTIEFVVTSPRPVGAGTDLGGAAAGQGPITAPPAPTTLLQPAMALPGSAASTSAAPSSPMTPAPGASMPNTPVLTTPALTASGTAMPATSAVTTPQAPPGLNPRDARQGLHGVKP